MLRICLGRSGSLSLLSPNIMALNCLQAMIAGPWCRSCYLLPNMKFAHEKKPAVPKALFSEIIKLREHVSFGVESFKQLYEQGHNG